MTVVGNISIASNNNENTREEQGTTHIAFVIDRSGSMSDIKEETVSEINRQISTIKNDFKNLPTKVSLVWFDSKVEEVFFEQELENLKELSVNEYMPAGYTSMYDGIGYVVSKLKEVPDMGKNSTAFLLIVVTDGHENASKTYSGKQIASVIKELKETGKWTFTVLGANIDLDSLSSELNIDKGNVMSFTANSKGLKTAGTTLSTSFTNYSYERSRGITSVDSFYSTDDTSTNS